MPTDEGRGAIVRRLARLILILLGRRYMPETQWLAATLGVSTRTLMRDLRAMEDAGYSLPKRQNVETW